MEDRDDEGIPMPAGTEVSMLSPDVVLVSFPLPPAQIPLALTGAEQDIALQVFAGASNEQIARARGVTERTVGIQLEAIYRKLSIGSRFELVLLLRGTGDPTAPA
jgi:DNA-binding NarL/FixJ family response regulator